MQVQTSFEWLLVEARFAIRVEWVALRVVAVASLESERRYEAVFLSLFPPSSGHVVCVCVEVWILECVWCTALPGLEPATTAIGHSNTIRHAL